MRNILKHFMAENNDNQRTLAEKSGVTQPTIQRFLSGKHGNPNSATVKKLASAYKLSESQLRGDVPINNLLELNQTQASNQDLNLDLEDKEKTKELLKFLSIKFSEFSANKLNMLRQAAETPEEKVDDTKKIIHVLSSDGDKTIKKQNNND